MSYAKPPQPQKQAAEQKKPSIMGFDYRVGSVTKTQPPSGAEGNDWYRYVLEGGHSPISGWRQGSLEDVTEFAQRSADELNERRAGKSIGYARGRPAAKKA